MNEIASLAPLVRNDGECSFGIASLALLVRNDRECSFGIASLALLARNDGWKASARNDGFKKTKQIINNLIKTKNYEKGNN